ncbi:non-hydrolyzing UDP-N-acetylglucosamine 2-epimerase [Magnetococcales bacterium HHB-1]
MRVLVVFGTRPEAVKMIPVVQVLRRYRDMTCRVCVTGQHREMLDQVLKLFDIVPDDDFALMRPEQSLSQLTEGILHHLSPLLKRWRPDLVLVQGDTTTAFVSGLAAFYEKIPVGHVEAGLRTGDLYQPWPEEMNRRLLGVMAAWHFAPTPGAVENLRRENIEDRQIFLTGNTVIDALQMTCQRLASQERLRQNIAAQLPSDQSGVRSILVTAHRRESFGEGIAQICTAIAQLAKRSDLHILLSTHLNPQVRQMVFERLHDLERVTLLEPLDYAPFVYLMQKSDLILTDSGGIQEEAPALAKPVLVLRETTERPEAIAAGVARLVGVEAAKIVSETERLLDDSAAYQSMAQAKNPFGSGDAAEKIVKIIRQVM